MTQKEKGMPHAHPLDVKGGASEKRWQQSRHGLFQSVPISIAFVAISTGGKTSQMLTVANALLPIMERVVIFSHSHRLDPAYIDLKDKLKEKPSGAARRQKRTPSCTILSSTCPRCSTSSEKGYRLRRILDPRPISRRCSPSWMIYSGR